MQPLSRGVGSSTEYDGTLRLRYQRRTEWVTAVKPLADFDLVSSRYGRVGAKVDHNFVDKTMMRIIAR